MKAVLEFTYPQDEMKLKHALKGEDYYLALVEIDRMLADPQQFNYGRAKNILNEVLGE